MLQGMYPEERMGRKGRRANQAEPVPQEAGGSQRHDPQARAALELWITLSRSEWGSVVLVPAEPESSTAALAKLLADIGQKLSFVPVTAIAVSSLEFGSALALADLQGHVDRERQRSAMAPPQEVTAAPANGAAADGADSARPEPRSEAIAVLPAARLVISIPSVVMEPLGLAATQQADAVVVTVEMGRTRSRDLRRTIELIGREHVTGCILV
jgi:hypothetical protein